jgi:predicted transcriptional regulator
MLKFFKKRQKKFEAKVLRKNDISILILDERWNSLFGAADKSPEIIKCEEDLRELLKEQSRISTESKEITAHKKVCMDRILELTTEVFDNGNENAKNEMQECEKEIKRINERLAKITEEQDNMPGMLKEANLRLLEKTVNIVYFKIRANQKRVEELERVIEQERQSLKEHIDEKEALSQSDTDIYSYFHDLLGGEELEKLDREFFG